MDREVLTIVMPVRNRAKIMGPTLDSLGAQTLRPLRIVAVDNESTDGTPALLREWAADTSSAGLKIDVVSEPKPGACAARNRGLEEVISPYVSFFDSDDIAYPEYAESIVRGFEASDDADMLVWRKSVKKKEGGRRILPSHFKDLLKGQMLHAVIGTSCFAVKTDFLREAGGWSRNNLPCWQDWELGIRLLSANPRVSFLDYPLADICPQEESITGKRAADKSGEWEKAAAEVLKMSKGDDPERIRRLVFMRLTALAGRYRSEGAETEGRQLMDNILANVSSPSFKYRLRLLYKATSQSLPGALTIFSFGV